MAQLLHHGFERHARGTGGSFATAAPETLYIQDLLALFIEALWLEGVERHLCCVVAENGEFLPLVGNDLTLAEAPSSMTLDFAAEAMDETPLVVRLALRSESVDPERRARLHLIATIHALHALPLIEAGEDGMRDGHMLSARESECLRRAASGDSVADIGEQMGLSVAAARILLHRAAARFDTNLPT